MELWALLYCVWYHCDAYSWTNTSLRRGMCNDYSIVMSFCSRMLACDCDVRFE